MTSTADKYLLAVAGIMGSDLSCFGTAEAATGDSLYDLLSPRTGGVEVFLRETFDLGSPAFAGLDLISKAAKLVGEMGLIDGGRVALRVEEASLLQSADPPILAFRHVEDHGVGV